MERERKLAAVLVSGQLLLKFAAFVAAVGTAIVAYDATLDGDYPRAQAFLLWAFFVAWAGRSR